MSSKEQTLVVGASGLLGMEVVRRLRGAGRSVRALVRAGTAADKRRGLEGLGVELCTADLKDLGSLEGVCRDVTSVISTASAMLSRQEGDSIKAVDEDGQMNLVATAERLGVGRFVFISFPPNPLDFALQRAKRGVEARLRQGRMDFAVLQPAFFSEIWLSPAVGFDPVGGRVRIFGDGHGAVSWISLQDVARFAVAASEESGFRSKVLPLGGPDPLSQLQVLRIMEELGAPSCVPEHIPESDIEAQFANATNPFEEAFAALMLTVSRGVTLDPRHAVQLLPGRLVTVRDYANRLLGKTNDRKGDTDGTNR
jgi:NADH dehydrogenase